MTRSVVALLVLAAALVFVSFCVIVIDEREQGFRTVLGDPDPEFLGISFNRPVLSEPGLYLRIPGLHEVQRYNRRLQLFNAEAREELYLADQLAVEVDYYVTFRIANPQLVRERIPTRARLLRQLDDTSFSEVRDVLGQYLIGDLLSEKRMEIMKQITERCNEDMVGRGIEITDVRIRRIDYPEKNLPGVFERMRKDRDRVARKYRAEGDEEARKIRSKAELDSQVLRADAGRRSSELRGKGDSEATRIYAEAYNRDPEFYAFVRSLEAYRLALDKQTTVILSPNVPFLRHLFRGEAPPTP